MTAQQLKNSILKLAISGKLVPQDPNDEPASVLIEKIHKEKEKLIKERKIKKEKNPSYIFRGKDGLFYEKFISVGENITNKNVGVDTISKNVGAKICKPIENIKDSITKCINDEIPFEIPEGWEWCRLKNISQLLGGYAFKGNAYTNKGIRVIRISDFDNNGLLYNEYKYHVELSELGNYEIYNNDILMCMTGGTVGKSCILNNIKEKLYLNQRVADIRCIKLINQYYVYNVLISYYIQDIISSSKTSTNDNISMETIGDFLIPLPPLQEQQRIVTEIEKYLPLINEYDKLQTELDTLDKEFPEKLKKSILQEAIKGKLVEQDPSDEPASVLLDKIHKEKEKLIKEGKIKKDKNESVIYKRDNSYYEKFITVGAKQCEPIEKCIDDEIPFEIPEGWAWCRLGSICLIERGGSPRPIKNYITNDKNGINWIKIGDTNKSDKYITKTNEQILKEGIKYSRFVKKGDFLLTNSMSFGRPYILNIDGCIHDGWLVISNYEIAFDKLYLYWLLSSDYTHNVFSGIVSGAVVKNLNINKVSGSLLPIPPLNEQKRIVAEIEKYLTLINKKTTK